MVAKLREYLEQEEWTCLKGYEGSTREVWNFEDRERRSAIWDLCFVNCCKVWNCGISAQGK